MKFDNHEFARTETRYTYWVDPAEAGEKLSKLQQRSVKELLGYRSGELVYLGERDYRTSRTKTVNIFADTEVYRFRTAKKKKKRNRWSSSSGDLDRVGDHFAVPVWTPAIFLALVRIPGESWWACVQLGSERVLLREYCIIPQEEVLKAQKCKRSTKRVTSF